MTLIIALFAAGIILIVAEVFVPGGILGILGSLCVIVGIFFSYADYGTEGALIAGSAALVVTVIMLYFEFKVLPKTTIGQRLFLKKRIEGRSQKALGGEEIVGKVAKTVTPLAPTGVVLFEGVRIEAASKSGYIDRGEEVKITGKDTFRIIVSKIK